MQNRIESLRERRLGVWAELCVGLLILAFMVLIFSATFGKTSLFAQASSGRGPFFFPRIVLAGLALCVPFVLLSLRRSVTPLPPAAPLMRMVLLIGLTGLYCAAIGLIGFFLASALFGAAVPIFLGRRDIILILSVSLAYAAAVWALFEKVFLILLPASPWNIGV